MRLTDLMVTLEGYYPMNHQSYTSCFYLPSGCLIRHRQNLFPALSQRISSLTHQLLHQNMMIRMRLARESDLQTSQML
jgi:hypothetical protein